MKESWVPRMRLDYESENSVKRQALGLVRAAVERFPGLAMSYRVARDSRRARQEARETPMGFKLAGNRMMESGDFEVEETRIVKKLLPGVDVAINVGANIGYYCCLALSLDKPVVAFEPLHSNLQCLLRNIAANKWETRAEVFPLALSNTVGVVKLYGAGTGASLVKGWAGIPEHFFSLAPSTTLDKVLGSRFQGKKCLVLVDVEGAEQLMLEGALQFIEMQPKPIWMVEISISEHQPKGMNVNPNLRETFQLFWDRGYEAWTADRHCRMVESREIEKIVVSGENTLGTHNFLFIESGRGNLVLAA